MSAVAAAQQVPRETAIPQLESYPNRSGCGALFRSREPLNSTVEFTTRRLLASFAFNVHGHHTAPVAEPGHLN
jgi:hypothetical protein